VASSLATVAIASLGGPVAAGGAALRELVKHAEAAWRINEQATLLHRQVTGAITGWAAREHLQDMDQGLDLAVNVIAGYGASAQESAVLRYDAEKAAQLAVARAAKGRYAELTKYAVEDYVVVAKAAVRETYAAMYRQLGRDEKVLPAIIVLLEESRRSWDLLVGMDVKLDVLSSKVDRLPSHRAVSPRGPVVVGELPREPAAFVTRDQLGDLERALQGSRVGVVCALTGLRGVGKTHVAAAYARARIADGWGLVGWVDAETTDSLVGGLARVAEALGVADSDGDSLKSAENLRGHLQSRRAPGLLVLDNALEPDVVRRFLPAVGSTQIVITTGESAFSTFGQPVEVGQFSRDQSLGYLRERTGLEDGEGAARVANELGDLPLALASVASTVVGPPPLSYGEFLEEFSAFPVEKVLGRHVGQDYPRSTAAALLLSVRRVEGDDPTGLTATLLRGLSVLSADGVELELLGGLAGDAGPQSRRALRDALARCTSGSLVTWSTTGDVVLMHRLLARVLRDRDDTAQRLHETVNVALDQLTPRLFDERQAWSRRDEGNRLAGHVESLWDSVARQIGSLDLTEQLLAARGWAVRQLRAAADLPPAIDLGRRVATDSDRVLGADHPQTLASRNNLAGAYESAGRLAAAIPLYEQTLTDAVRVLGADHPQTLASRNNLAGAYESAGRLEAAIPLYEQTLTDAERVLGADHPQTLASRNNLAGAYQSAGRLAAAIPLYEQTLTDRERVLGADHPQTLASRNNLAGAYQSAGRLEAAIPLYEQTLTDAERVLGADHPQTLASRNNLAGAYESAGRLAAAIPLYEQTLTDRERVLGADHPDTLASRRNLSAAAEERAR
jgi:tetratricopeptide (TPR) repeat protein/uncharacterized membrane protein (UPF0136 family)